MLSTTPPTLQLCEAVLGKAPPNTVVPQNVSLRCLAGLLEWEVWQSVEKIGVVGEKVLLASAVRVAIPFFCPRPSFRQWCRALCQLCNLRSKHLRASGTWG